MDLIHYIVIIGIILLISWSVRYMVQRDLNKRRQK